MFEELEEWKRNALYMHVHLGKSGAEIGRELGISPRTVTDNLRRLENKFTPEEIIDYEGLFDDQGDIQEKPTELVKISEENGDVINYRVKKLFYDIETTLAIAYHWGHWKQNIGMAQKIQESHLLSHAWAWNDDETEGSVLTPEEVLARDPLRLIDEAWHLLDECDVLIAHNGKKFDVKMMNTMFIEYGYEPPSPFKVQDTMTIAKRKFRFDFNSLSFIAHKLGVQEKRDAGGINTWIRCASGDQEALDTMMYYNKGDVETLREVYNRLITWDNDGVNFSAFTNHDCACPHCSGHDLEVVPDRYVTTAQQRYHLFRCRSCGAKLRGNTKLRGANGVYRVI